MNVRALLVSLAAASLVGASMAASPVSAVAPSAAQGTGPDLISEPVRPALSPALRDLPASTAPTRLREVPEGGIVSPDTPPDKELPEGPNAAGPAQREVPGLLPADLVPVDSFVGGTTDSFAGQSTPNSSPPDTVGDVGPNHYVQMVNSQYQIWNKQGTSLAGPTDISALWSGLPAGTPCRVTNNGDPIVLYDQAADRWMLAQFSISSTPDQMCIAYSTTADPTGTYNAYAFDMPALPDYEKFGVWPDGLYMSTYEFPQLGAYVFDRTAMLAGSFATFQRFGISAGGGPRVQRILPGDWDGALAPPAGAPNPFLMSVDAQVQGGADDRLELYNFHVDWGTPTNSTFTLDQTLPTDPFNIDIGSNCMSGASFRSCIPQPGTAIRVDDLSNRLMWRLQYRNFGDHQAMVTNQTVNSGNNTAALRWYELRATGTSWAIHQQNTFAPAGSDYRWMGSAAMDGSGNIALGYSISNATDLFPSINYTGQRVGSALNTMSESETRMFTGASSQTDSSRWGDYSAMSVDPVDECTFWYTQMHGGSRETRIGTAHFTSCAQPTAQLKLVKKTNPSTVDADLWTLKADAVAPLEGKNYSKPGGSGALTTVYANTAYTLSEAGGPASYTPSAWLCTKDGQNTPYPGLSGSILTLTAGDAVTCEITNTHNTAELKLQKAVTGDNGAKGPGDWNLTATAAAPLTDKNFTVAGTNDSFSSVYTDTAYTLTESGPANYTGSWVCTGRGVTQSGATVTLDTQGQGTCVLTNDRNTAQLSLEKKVTGGDKTPADWVLRAETTEAGALKNRDVSRAGNATTPAVVYSGIDYVLSEVGAAGTDKYNPGDWTCKTVPDGVAVSVRAGHTISLTKGQHVACTIVNSRDVGALKIVKELNSQDSGFSGTFDVEYSCVDGAAVKKGSVKLAAGTSQTIPDVPTGSVCTVTEPTLPKAPAGWAFGAPRFDPASGQVSVTSKNEVASVTVSNVLTRTSPARQPCPIQVRLHTPKPTKVGNRLLTDRIATRKSACAVLQPIVLCRPLAPNSAGEKVFCDATVTRKGRIRVDTKGSAPLRVTVIVRARPLAGAADAWRTDTWRRSWRLT